MSCRPPARSRAFVFYEKSGLWEDATDQAFKQAKVVPKFIKQQFGLTTTSVV